MAYTVSSGQILTGIELTSNTMEILGGGIAQDTVINSAGDLKVLSGGSAGRTVVNAEGSLVIETGGTATDVVWTPCVGTVSIAPGAQVSFASQLTGVYLGQNDTLLAHSAIMIGRQVTGSMYVADGGIASSTAVDGVLEVARGGFAKDTTVTNQGALLVGSGGVASKAEISSKAEAVVHTGGKLYDSEVNNASLAVFMGYTENTTLNGSVMQVALWSDAKNITVNADAELVVFNNAYAENITVNSDGLAGCYGNALLNYVTVKKNGELAVTSGGISNNVVVESAGLLNITGQANNTYLKSGANCTLYSGLHTGTLMIEKGASFMALYGTIEFSIFDRTSQSGYLINDVSQITGLPNFTIQVAKDQLSGTYKLAQGASNFAYNITLHNGVNNLGTLRVNGADTALNGKVYSLDQAGGNLTLTVIQQDIDLVPYTPKGWSDKIVIAANSTDRTDASEITTEDNVFISWAALNNGTVNIANTFSTQLYIDGELFNTWNSNGLQAGYYTGITGCNIGKLSAGVHTVKLVTDSANSVGEVNYNNNTYTRKFIVNAPGNTIPLVTGNVSCQIKDGAFTVDWADVTCPDFAGYQIRFVNPASKAEDSIFVSESSCTQILPSTASGTLFFQIRTVLNSGQCSGWSDKYELEVLPGSAPVFTADTGALGNKQSTMVLSSDNFRHFWSRTTADGKLDLFSTPGGAFQVKAYCNNAPENIMSWSTVVNGRSETELISTANGTLDVFFANAGGTWSGDFAASHQGNSGGWEGTGEKVLLEGKNRLSDIFKGSADSNILLLTDDANGDALFLEDIYSVLGDQARLSQVKEIMAGAGNDIIDLTGKQFAYAGENLTVYGGHGNDTIWANSGTNMLYGDSGDDRLVGAALSDTIVGGSGNDSMHGGGGSDIFTFGGNWGHDFVQQLSGGTIILWFETGSLNFWNSSTLTYSDGVNSVTVAGVAAENISIFFGDQLGAESFAAFKSISAFADSVSGRVFEENPLLA